MSFANQLQEEFKFSQDHNQDLKATILTSFCEHYYSYLPIIIAEKEKLRNPIESFLKDKVKLVKWDQRS